MTFKRMIIAEIGSVHDGSFGNAKRLIEAAAACGADAVKFQTHISEAETLKDAPSPSYFKAEPRFEYFNRTGFTFSQWQELKDCCEKSNVLFMSSPFSLEAVDLLEKLGMSIYKIPSGEVTNIPFLERVAQTKKPVILSSGMSSWEELDFAVNTLKKGGPLSILQCTSEYPCTEEKVGLNILNEMKNRYQVPIGLSDHTMGFAAPLAAVAMGAVIIEKHFSFSRLMYGSDAKHSMVPEEFTLLCKEIKSLWKMLDHPVNKSDVSAFQDMKSIFQKSIVLACDLDAGTLIEKKHLAFKKPGDGISASEYQSIIGKKLVRKFNRDHKLEWKDLE